MAADDITRLCEGLSLSADERVAVNMTGEDKSNGVIKRKPFYFSMKVCRNTVIGVEWWVTLFENVCRIRTFEFNRDVSVLRYGAWLRASSPVKGRPSWPSRRNQSPPSQGNMAPHHDQLGTVTDNQPVQGGTVSPNPQQQASSETTVGNGKGTVRNDSKNKMAVSTLKALESDSRGTVDNESTKKGSGNVTNLMEEINETLQPASMHEVNIEPLNNEVDRKSDCGPGQEAASGPDRNVALSTVEPSPMVMEEDHHLEPSNKPNKPRWKRLARNKGKFSDNSRGDKARSKSGRESVNWGWWFCEEI
ncbi:hypothetical protein ACOSQ4_021841 [Xanthoceras sorbifolium]